MRQKDETRREKGQATSKKLGHPMQLYILNLEL